MHYFALHKPYGVVAQFTPSGHAPTLASLGLGLPRSVYPLGRLDADSEGLLLLTDDTALNDRLLHPRHAHPRTYHAQVEGTPSPEALAALAAGPHIRIGGKAHPCRPALASLLPADPGHPPRQPPIRHRASIPTAWLQLTLTEGKNRQVRRMTAAVGLPTLRLLRVAVGRLGLGSLPPGAVRQFSRAEFYALLGL